MDSMWQRVRAKMRRRILTTGRIARRGEREKGEKRSELSKETVLFRGPEFFCDCLP